MKKIFLIPIIVLCACKPQTTDEEGGQQMLAEARACYASGNYTAARDTILSMRKRFPTAFEARQQAILLMDSVELQLAEGDSLKSEFFRRKLEHDRKELKEKN